MTSPVRPAPLMRVMRAALCAILMLCVVAPGIATAQGRTMPGAAGDVTRSPGVQKLKKRLGTGEITEGEARGLFAKLPPSEWVKARLASVDAAVDAQVAGGSLSAQDAVKRKKVMTAEVHSMAFSLGVLGLSNEEAGIRAVMQARRMTREQAKAFVAKRGRDESNAAARGGAAAKPTRKSAPKGERKSAPRGAR